ncbi:uncharacterized protein [Prorops nasuta]|uniref:uncharacterized protein n=1 Tax=Prorops nasuta TaxID=863751 RepID=UPI0034CF3B74
MVAVVMKCDFVRVVVSSCVPGRSVMIASIVLLFVFSFRTVNTQISENVTSNFVDRCRMDCSLQGDFQSCGKYRVVRWLNDVVREKEFTYGPFRIIRIPSMPHQTLLPKLPRTRAFRSGIVETLNFVRDAAEDLLTKRAIVYTIENPTTGRGFSTAPMIVDADELDNIERKSEGEWRIFKKKKMLILPILILLNLLKLKLLLIPIFLGVHFIKKMIVLGSFILPSILAHLKICKVPPPPTYPYQAWATADEVPVDYPAGFGNDDAGWAHRNDIQGHYGYPGYGYRNPYG